MTKSRDLRNYGTAALENTQTSSTDTTANALMAVGAFGLGATTVQAAPNNDLNDITVSGDYYGSAGSSANMPSSGISFQVTHNSVSNADFAVQTAIGYGGSVPTDINRMFVRHKDSGVWESWNEIITADSAGNVGIGTSFPTAPLHTVSSENLVAKFSSSDVTSGIRIEDTTTSYDFYVDSGNLRINNTAGLERLRIDAAGDVEFSSGNGGIYLGGRAAANRLDHYEEGTWTPTVGGTWSTAPTALSGTYIKIGSLVYVKVNFSGGAKTSATTGWIDGNPFNQVGGGSTGSVSDSSVSDRGNCLFANTTRIWLTSTSFSGGANYLSGSYNTDA